jgi:hypothetical protein
MNNFEIILVKYLEISGNYQYLDYCMIFTRKYDT